MRRRQIMSYLKLPFMFLATVWIIVCDPPSYCSSKSQVCYRITYFLMFLCQSLISSLTSDEIDSLRKSIFWNKKKNFKSYFGEIEGYKVCILTTNTDKFKVMKSYIYIYAIIKSQETVNCFKWSGKMSLSACDL